MLVLFNAIFDVFVDFCNCELDFLEILQYFNDWGIFLFLDHAWAHLPTSLNSVLEGGIFPIGWGIVQRIHWPLRHLSVKDLIKFFCRLLLSSVFTLDVSFWFLSGWNHNRKRILALSHFNSSDRWPSSNLHHRSRLVGSHRNSSVHDVVPLSLSFSSVLSGLCSNFLGINSFLPGSFKLLIPDFDLHFGHFWLF